MKTKLKALEDNGKYYTSSDNLNELSKSGAIKKELISFKEGMHWRHNTWHFTTVDGLFLAKVVTGSFGFSSHHSQEIPLQYLP